MSRKLTLFSPPLLEKYQDGETVTFIVKKTNDKVVLEEVQQ